MTESAGMEKPSRNKELTKERIMTAVEEILAREGYQALGINRIARDAGVGKVLIYRYFGGLEGVLDAYSETDRFWPSIEEIRGLPTPEFELLTLRERIKVVFHNFRQALKRRPHTIAIYAWEMVEKSDISKQLVAVRTQSSINLVREMLGASRPSSRNFEHEITAMLAAGLLHLTIREHFETPFAGLKLQEEETWNRLEAALDQIFHGLEVLKAQQRAPQTRSAS